MHSAWIVTAVFGICYVLEERLGIFKELPSSFAAGVYSLPFLLSALLLLGISAAVVRRSMRPAGIRRWTAVLSAALVVSGFWISYLTGFQADFIITEGQEIAVAMNDALPGSLRRGMFGKPPEITLALAGLASDAGLRGDSVGTLRGEFMVQERNDRQPRSIRVTNRFPNISNGLVFFLTGFGYSPRFVLSEQNGKILDSAFVSMRLFPPGTGDYFRVILPHTFSLQYAPGLPDRGTAALTMRIARNKDLLFNGPVKLGEKVPFDNGIIAIEEVRTWANVTLCRDYGIFVSLAGLCSFLLSFLLPNRLRMRKDAANVAS